MEPSNVTERRRGGVVCSSLEAGWPVLSRAPEGHRPGKSIACNLLLQASLAAAQADGALPRRVLQIYERSTVLAG
jgi:hypothetical protein